MRNWLIATFVILILILGLFYFTQKGGGVLVIPDKSTLLSKLCESDDYLGMSVGEICSIAGVGGRGCGMPASHTKEEAKEYIARVMASYSDLMYADVPEPAYDNCSGLWTANVTLRKGRGIEKVMIKIYDDNLTLKKVYVEAPRPPEITMNKLITNGTVQLYGKISCSKDKIRIMEFSDPYCPPCILAEDKMNAFKEKYNDSIEFEYHILLTTSRDMQNYFGKMDVERISKYFICAQEQGLLDPLKACAIYEYRKRGKEEPLPRDILDSCIPTEINRTEFDACVERAHIDMSFDEKLAQTYGIKNTPMVMIDCRYRVHPTYLEHGFCFLYSNVTGCS